MEKSEKKEKTRAARRGVELGAEGEVELRKGSVRRSRDWQCERESR